MAKEIEPFLLLKKYLPNHAYPIIASYLKNKTIIIKITPPRRTKAGDFTVVFNKANSCRITINNSGNPYEFLITLVHEIAHFYVYLKYNKAYREIKPHAIQWKRQFSSLMQPLMTPKVFPQPLLGKIKKHMLDPKASTGTDALLVKALNQYSPKSKLISVQDIAEGADFLFQNRRRYTKGRKKIKRIECIETSTGKKYLFHPYAMVESL